jgi:hypothetical protein
VDPELVGLGVDVGDERVEAQVDRPLLVPRLVVDGDGVLGQFSFRELLDQDAIVQGFPLVGDDRDIGVRTFLVDRLGRRTAGDPVAEYHVRSAHIRRSGSPVKWVAIAASLAGAPGG